VGAQKMLYWVVMLKNRDHVVQQDS